MGSIFSLISVPILSSKGPHKQQQDRADPLQALLHTAERITKSLHHRHPCLVGEDT